MDKSFPLSGFSSAAVHGGHRQDPNYAHQVPIYASSTYVYDTAEQGMRRFMRNDIVGEAGEDHAAGQVVARIG